LKERILRELYTHKGEYVSGEGLSIKLNVSRTAIWKHINALKNEGYIIQTTQKKGYRLLKSTEKLTPEELKINLTTKELGKKIIYFESIDSTNAYGKKIALSAEHGTLIISEEQQEGRGRMGKNWFSPEGEGIWMSLILKPPILLSEGTKLTQIAAAAACMAIRNVTGLEAYIKWPNDIVVHGKKVCGILTEMAGELNRVNYLIVGIGINVNTKNFPQELIDKATSLAIEKGEPVDRKTLAINLLSLFEEYYLLFIEKDTLEKTMEICRSYSTVLGKPITIIHGEDIIKAHALEINEEGFLKVKLEDGRQQLFSSGEVSVRGDGTYI
jgi:BirA family transcriptional regulator, biotin operon repressor / biotin---[acetyl-CoA-carboxylase] ligase